MAESQAVAKEALKKLGEQLTCSICLDAFKDPKLLQCFHVYCKDCLQRLVVTDGQGQLSLCCPICRQSTLLPQATGVSDLQPAFHIHHFFEIKDALEKVKEPQKALCGKCKTLRPAISYCRVCREFICTMCTTIHSEWDILAKHEVVPLEQLENKMKLVDTLKKVTLYCSLHEGKELELYCDTCEELICHNCTVKKHKAHQYDLVADTFDGHQTEITESVKPIKSQLSVVRKSLEELDLRSKELNDHRESNKTKVQRQAQELHDLIDKQKAELFNQIDQQTDTKLKNVAAQKNEVETVQTQMVSCLLFVEESLRTGSKGEVMKVKKTVMKQVKEMTERFNPDTLSPCELANVRFALSPHNAPVCQQFGTVYLQQASPEKCYATGKGLKEAKPNQMATVVVHIVDSNGKAVSVPKEVLCCEIVSKFTGDRQDCSMKEVKDGRFEVSYEVEISGCYQLDVKVENEDIKESPFIIIARNLVTPIRVISNVKRPTCIALEKDNIVVIENSRKCVSVYDPMGEKLHSFGSEVLSNPRGVAVDDDGNILVVDMDQNCIFVFASDGKFFRRIGKMSKSPLEFEEPVGVTIHPQNKRLYVADQSNNRIQILKPDLSFFSTFGSKGQGNGQFKYPADLACDRSGNVYVADYGNSRIQVFSANGQLLRKFGELGESNGKLHGPSRICVTGGNEVFVSDTSNDRISIFTLEGKYVTSFGMKGNKPGQFNEPRGIGIDKNGVIYVCDCGNNRLQLFY